MPSGSEGGDERKIRMEMKMKTTIVSPKMYTYGSLVLGGILRARGHAVTITRDLASSGDVTLLSLFSTSQLLDPEIRDFAKSPRKIYVGGPVCLVPEIVLGELDNPIGIIRVARLKSGEVRLGFEGFSPDTPIHREEVAKERLRQRGTGPAPSRS